MQGGARGAEGGVRVTEVDPKIGPGHQRACAGHPCCKMPGTLNLEKAPRRLPLGWTQTSGASPLARWQSSCTSLPIQPALLRTLSDSPKYLDRQDELQQVMQASPHALPLPPRDSSAVSDGGTRQRGIRGSRLSSAWRLHVSVQRDGLISGFGDLVAC